MERILLLLHLIGLALSIGGLVGQLVLLTRFHDSENPSARAGSELMSETLASRVQKPGTYLAAATGAGLLWLLNWEPLSSGYLQFKLLFAFWVILAARLMSANTKNLVTLRTQCGEQDSDRLRSLKDNLRRIGYVTVLAFLFIMILSLWKPL